MAEGPLPHTSRGRTRARAGKSRPQKEGRSSPRPISTGALHALRRFQGPPINVVLYHGPYPLNAVRGLILRRASRLDAFSAYPYRTSATRRCRWHDNRYTGGPSIPVLSY